MTQRTDDEWHCHRENTCIGKRVSAARQRAAAAAAAVAGGCIND